MINAHSLTLNNDYSTSVQSELCLNFIQMRTSQKKFQKFNTRFKRFRKHLKRVGPNLPDPFREKTHRHEKNEKNEKIKTQKN